MCRRLSLLFASELMFKDRVLSDVSPTVVFVVPNAARVPAVTDLVERSSLLTAVPSDGIKRVK